MAETKLPTSTVTLPTPAELRAIVERDAYDALHAGEDHIQTMKDRRTLLGLLRHAHAVIECELLMVNCRKAYDEVDWCDACKLLALLDAVREEVPTS